MLAFNSLATDSIATSGGQTAITGQIAWTDQNDVMTANGTVIAPITGAAAWTDQNDTWSVFGVNGTITARAHWRNMFW